MKRGEKAIQTPLPSRKSSGCGGSWKLLQEAPSQRPLYPSSPHPAPFPPSLCSGQAREQPLAGSPTFFCLVLRIGCLGGGETRPVGHRGTTISATKIYTTPVQICSGCFASLTIEPRALGVKQPCHPTTTAMQYVFVFVLIKTNALERLKEH